MNRLRSKIDFGVLPEAKSKEEKNRQKRNEKKDRKERKNEKKDRNERKEMKCKKNGSLLGQNQAESLVQLKRLF